MLSPFVVSLQFAPPQHELGAGPNKSSVNVTEVTVQSQNNLNAVFLTSISRFPSAYRGAKKTFDRFSADRECLETPPPLTLVLCESPRTNRVRHSSACLQ